MAEKQISTEEKKSAVRKAKTETKKHETAPPGGENAALVALQKQVGNRAVQRLLAQRSGDGPFELDDDTAQKINQERGGGQALDSTVQTQMGNATGHDFGDVKVHTGPEAHELNEQLGAKAFTTGKDIFFREGAYNPGSSGGQQLLAHELTHVVQQGTGQVGGGGKMTVNSPGDAFEQEADAVSKTMTSPDSAASAQRQVDEDEVQMQEEEKKEEVQLQEEEEKEDEILRQEIPEGEEEEEE